MPTILNISLSPAPQFLVCPFSFFTQKLNMLQHQNPFVLSFSAFFLAFLCHCSATTFTVGDSAGWIIPPYPTYYNNWSHSHFIRVGDSVGISLMRNALIYYFGGLCLIFALIYLFYY